MVELHFAVILTVSFLPSLALAQASRSPIAPRRELVEATVRDAYEKFRNDTGGKNADYIPYLARVESKLFGIAIVTTDNQVLTLGDVNYSFSIQSISKVFTLALAMEELGQRKFFRKLTRSPPAVHSIRLWQLWTCQLTRGTHWSMLALLPLPV